MHSKLQDVLGVDLRSLAVIRMGMALLILADLFARSFDLSAHYSDVGIFPRFLVMALPGGPHHPSLYSLHGSTWLAAGLFLLAGVFAVGLLVGYRTRLCALASFVLLLSLQHRNPVVIDGADDLLLTLLFWSLFLPIQARGSIDAALMEGERPKQNRNASIATAALVLQVACLYLVAAFRKSGDPWWPDGTALYFVLHLDQWVTPLGQTLRELPMPLLQFTTYGVLALEFAAPVLLLSPWWTAWTRALVVPLLAAMHASFLFFMELGMFPFANLLALTALVPTAWWDAFSRRVRTPARRGLTIFYDGDCSACLKWVSILKELLVLSDARIERADASAEARELMERHSSWVIRDAEDSHHFRYDALVVLVRHSPLFFWLAWPMSLPPVRRLGDASYRRFAGAGRGRFVAGRLRSRPIHLEPSPRGKLIAGICLLWVLGHNITSLEQVEAEFPPWLAMLGKPLRLNQNWSFFSPYPSPADGWYVVAGSLEDGTPVDALNGRANVNPWTRPDSFYETFPRYRWRAALTGLRRPPLELTKPFYASYFCRRWNHSALPGRRLRDLQILFMLEVTEPGGGPFPIQQVELFQFDCPAPRGRTG